MSIADQIKSSAKTQSGDSWSTIFHRKADDNRYLQALRAGQQEVYSIPLEEESDTYLNMRVLTCHEEVLLSHWTQDYINNFYGSSVPEDKKREREDIVHSMLRIMMACTSPNVTDMKSTIKTYDDNTAFPLCCVSKLKNQELSRLIKEYQYVDQQFNPQIETMSNKEAWEVIEAVKKQDIPLKDLSYPALLSITTALIEHSKLEDEMLSTALQEQQS